MEAKDFIAPTYVDIEDCGVEWILLDFRDKKFADYTPDQLRMQAEMEREAKRNFWLAASILAAILTALTLYGVWL